MLFKTNLEVNLKKGIKFRRTYKEFFPRYLKNTIVKAKKGTVGILSFEDKDSAEEFIGYHTIQNCSIIRVKTIGRIKRNPPLLSNCGNSLQILLDFKLKEEYYELAYYNINVIASPSVEVLE